LERVRKREGSPMSRNFSTSLVLFLVLGLSTSQAMAFGKKASGPQAADPDFPMLPTNPLTDPDVPRVGDHDYSVNVKFTNHGLTDLSADTVNRLVRSTEKIYSQCEGVNFHVHVVATVQAPYTTDQDDVTGATAGVLQLGDRFQKFYSQFPNNPESGIISVDLVDDMDPSIRADEHAGKQGESFLGQALPASVIDNLYQDNRSPQYRTGALSELGGNTIRLAMETLKISEANKPPVTHINNGTDIWGNPKMKVAFRSYESTLLAHEMGHILMEVQDGKGEYIDHYCPGAKKQCGPDMMMSPGGYNDRVYLRVPQMDTPIGYSPLAKVESAQCEALKRHPLVKLEN
jgi:hypothetical protein